MGCRVWGLEGWVLLEGVAVSPGVLVGLSWVSIVAGRCGGLARRTSFAGRACFALALPVGAPSFLHAVPTAQGGGRSCRLPTFCPYGASAVVGLPRGERCRVFTFRTYSTSRWLVLEVTYILPLWGIGCGWPSGGRALPVGGSPGGGRKAGVAQAGAEPEPEPRLDCALDQPQPPLAALRPPSPTCPPTS